MTIVGGLRDRLLKDSLYAHVAAALDALGWLDTSRRHRPINLIEKPEHWDVAVAPNTVAVDFVGSDVEEWEVGSLLTSDIHVGHVEIYAETDSLGTHLAEDIRDWLRGRLQEPPVPMMFPIYDFRQGATPAVIGRMDIGDVSTVRNVTVNDEIWLRHWFRVRCEIRDTYLGLPYGLQPSPIQFPTSNLYPGP